MSKRSVLDYRQNSVEIRCWGRLETRQGAEEDKERHDKRYWGTTIRPKHLEWLSWAAADEQLSTRWRVPVKLCKVRECHTAWDYSMSGRTGRREWRESWLSEREGNCRKPKALTSESKSLYSRLLISLQPLSPFSQTQEPPPSRLWYALEDC